MSRNTPFTWILLMLSSLVLLFILAPLAGMFLHTGGSELLETVNDQEVRASIWLTIWVAFAATFFFAIGAIPLAWLWQEKNSP